MINAASFCALGRCYVGFKMPIGIAYVDWESAEVGSVSVGHRGPGLRVEMRVSRPLLDASKMTTEKSRW